MKTLTKVEAVVAIIKKHKGQATWEQIYNQIERFYPGAKNSKFWQEGIRGIVYREIRYGRTFEMASRSTVALRNTNNA